MLFCFYFPTSSLKRSVSIFTSCLTIALSCWGESINYISWFDNKERATTLIYLNILLAFRQLGNTAQHLSGKIKKRNHCKKRSRVPNWRITSSNTIGRTNEKSNKNRYKKNVLVQNYYFRGIWVVNENFRKFKKFPSGILRKWQVWNRITWILDQNRKCQ